METKRLLSKTGYALLLKGLSALAGFILSIVLARTYGKEGTAYFYLTYSLLLVCVVICKFGFTTFILKEFSGKLRRESKKKINRIFTKVLLLSTTTSLIIFFFRYEISLIFFQNIELTTFLVFAAFALTPYTLSFIFSALNQARGNIKIAMITQNFICYAGTVILVYLFGAFYSPDFSLLAFCVASIISFIFASFFYSKNQSHNIKILVGPGLFKSEKNINYFISEVLVALNNWMPILLVSYFFTASDSGLFAICSRLAWLLTFLLVSVNAVIAPVLSNYFKLGKLSEAKELYIKFTLLIAAASIPVVILLFYYAEFALSFFGAEFLEGSVILKILISSQLINILTGPVNLLLLMGKHSHIANYCNLFSFIVSAVFLMILTVDFGLIGAATGAALSMSIPSLTMFIMVFVKLKIFKNNS